MMELNELKTIPGFKRMELPLDKDEYQRLENEILADGYKKPFIFWNEFLLMDYDAYEICRQHEVDVDVVNEDYPSVEVAISEISKHHLASEKTNENMKKYLIGCRFHAEKTLAKMKPKFSDSQYSYDNSASKTRERLAKEYGVNSQTIYKYGIYTDILNQIDTESHELFLKVLRDEIRVSIDALQAVLKMSSMPRRKAIDTLLSGKKQKTSPAVSTVSTKPETKERVIVEQTIKGIPVYNPDSELKSLQIILFRLMLLKLQKIIIFKILWMIISVDIVCDLWSISSSPGIRHLMEQTITPINPNDYFLTKQKNPHRRLKIKRF